MNETTEKKPNITIDSVKTPTFDLAITSPSESITKIYYKPLRTFYTNPLPENVNQKKRVTRDRILSY